MIDKTYKKELRRYFMSKRQALQDVSEKSEAISQQFFRFFDLEQISKIHLFLPILKFNEINTWVLIHHIWHKHPHITPIVSKSNLHTYNMVNYILSQDTIIVKNKWGIPEPIHAIKCPDKTIDMVLIPLLCFDKQGFRVGYGKGFYDRFLLKCRKDVIKIGCSLFEPVTKIADIHDNDVKMDYCVMNDRVLKIEN